MNTARINILHIRLPVDTVNSERCYREVTGS